MTGGCSERRSGRNHEVEDGSLRTGRSAVEWYSSISPVLEEHGWHRLKSDSCCWILIDPDLVKTGNTQGVMARPECAVAATARGHVDDFALIGRSDAALQNRIDGGSTKGLLFRCSSVKALQGEGALMFCDQLEEWPNRQSASQCYVRRDGSHGGSGGRTVRAAIPVLRDVGQHSSGTFSPDKMAPLVPGAFVTDSKGLHDKVQTQLVWTNRRCL